MEIIPVIDLSTQQVVHARRGERERYQPIRSSLCATSAPLDVVRAMLGLYPFKHLYIADLDAIQKRGQHLDTVAAIRQTYPKLEIWVDAGVGRIEDLQDWRALDINMVVGSESVATLESYLELQHTLKERMVLSLDFDSQGFRGPTSLLERPACWPQRVIVMTLAKVGSAEGPDIDRISAIAERHPRASIYAAGGVRGIADIDALSSLGIQGALVASAIHDGTLFPAAGNKTPQCLLPETKTPR